MIQHWFTRKTTSNSGYSGQGEWHEGLDLNIKRQSVW